jgi:hypothetical protein
MGELHRDRDRHRAIALCHRDRAVVLNDPNDQPSLLCAVAGELLFFSRHP